jgi:hypothetical protein
MSTHPQWSTTTRFEGQGSLKKPGPMGRIVRLGLGVFLLSWLYSLLTQGGALLGATAPRNPSFWLATLFALHVTPYVVNLGFTVSWKRWPQVIIVVAAAIAVALDLVLYGSWWGPPLGGFLLTWLIYFSAHLGLSFILSSIIATPGCEMRAIPHLWTLLTGRATQEHYCPGPLDRLDTWERRGRAA